MEINCKELRAQSVSNQITIVIVLKLFSNLNTHKNANIANLNSERISPDDSLLASLTLQKIVASHS